MANETPWRQNLIRIDTDPELRLWTGYGELTLAGKTYQGGGAALEVSEVETASGAPDRRVTLRLSAIPRAARRQFLQDVGPRQVTVEWVYSRDRGASWHLIPNAAAPLSFKGRLSTPSLSQGGLTVEVETLRGDVDRGQPRRWSHEDQQRRYAGDDGLEYMRVLARESGVNTGWPQ